MTFLAPVPWEADAFYAQPGMAERGLTLDQWPVGTGPYMVTEFVKDRRIVMQRNPNYRGEPYPCEGAPDDQASGLLRDCGKPTPFVDAIVATVEREGTPMRNKFRDGYYDLEVFERTDTGNSYIVEMNDSEDVRAEYLKKGFDFPRSADVNSYIVGFNMIDPVIGMGDTPEQQRAQSQAAPGDLDRDRLGGVRQDLPQEGRRHGDEPAAAGHPRLARRHASGRQPRHPPRRGRARRAPADRGRAPADGRRPATRTAATRRPAGRSSSTTTSTRRPRRNASPRSTGWCGSSPSSTSSSRCARPTTTSSRTRCARASTRCSGWAGLPTTRTPRTSCSCSTDRTRRASRTARTPPTTRTRPTTACSAGSSRSTTGLPSRP